MKGANAALQRQRNDMIWHAWHVEAFARQKRLPRLESLLRSSPEKPERRKMAPEEIQSVMAGVFARKKGILT